MNISLTGWILFNGFILVMLLLDLMVFHRKAHEVRVREALIWSAVWIAFALIFTAIIFHYKGHDLALKFFTGYLVEKSLSVDNLFVFLLIFEYFRVPQSYQHKVLFWGIFGALVMRAIFIFAGIALIQKFHWMVYILGGFLIFSGIKFAMEKEKEVHPEKNPVLKLFRKLMPVTHDYEKDHFIVRRSGKTWATPLLVVLLVIETTDVIFAVDSVPAVIAISLDPFIVYSSNAFAILGLRALYFALAGMMRMFHYLHYGLAAILVFVGIKMVIQDFFHIPLPFALAFIGATLVFSTVWSMVKPPPKIESKIIT